MVLFGWPHYQDSPSLGKAGSYPLSNEHFDPVAGNVLLDEYMEEVQLCDRLGYDGVCLQEHHGNGAYSAFTANTHVTAAAMSRITENIKIAIMGTRIPLHNPVTVAEDLALLDHLTKGRPIWGALRGTPSEYLSYGINPTESQGRFREAYDLIVKALTTVGPFDFDGEFYRVRDCNIWPRPLQAKLRTWMACNSADTLEFALDRGTYVATGIMDSARAGALYQQSRDIVNKNGIDLADEWDEWFGGIALIYVAESDAIAKRDAAEHVKRYQRALSLFDSPTGTLIPGYRSPQALKGFLAQSLAAQASESRDITSYSLDEGMEKGIFIVGSPDSVLEQLRRKKEESRINVLLSFMRFGAMTKDEAFSSIQLFADEVLPKARDL